MIEGRDDFDYSRHAVFCAFGFTYLGAFQYWLYNIKFTQWCGSITARVGHIGTAPVKVAIDQLLQYVLGDAGIYIRGHESCAVHESI